MQPLTVEDLRSLRTEEVRNQQARLIAQYAAAIRARVLEEAKYGTASHVHFWLVPREIARAYLNHVTGQFYPWHSKYIEKSGYLYQDAMLTRPVPYELVVPIGEVLGRYFPDAVIEIVDSRFLVEGERQHLLVVRWNHP